MRLNAVASPLLQYAFEPGSTPCRYCSVSDRNTSASPFEVMNASGAPEGRNASVALALPDAELTTARRVRHAGADHETHRVRRELRCADLRVGVGERLRHLLAGRVELAPDLETGQGLRERRVALDGGGQLAVAGAV